MRRPETIDSRPASTLRHLVAALALVWASSSALAALLAAPTLAAAQDGSAEQVETHGAATQDPDRRRIVTLEGTDLGLPFSPGVVHGDLLYLSGALGNVPGTTEVPGDVPEQTTRTLANLRAVLAAEGLDFDDVVSADVFLADARAFGFFSAAWAKDFSPHVGDFPPVRATVEAAIALTPAHTEVSMIAARTGVETKAIVPAGWPAHDASSPRPYSWGVQAGRTLFVAGMVSADPAEGVFVDGPIDVQVRATMDNVQKVLETAGLGWSDVARCRVFLADARHYGAMNEAYSAYFAGGGKETDAAPPPARSTVQARLVLPRGLVEIQCVAVAGDDRRAVVMQGGTAPDRPFSHAIAAGGTLYLAGMVGRGEDGYPAGVEAQTRVALDRVRRTLAAEGLDWSDIVSVQVYLTDIRHYAAMNQVYSEVLVGDRLPPARATVGTPLASPDALVEIEVTAALR